jgi:hypothetical protein
MASGSLMRRGRPMRAAAGFAGAPSALAGAAADFGGAFFVADFLRVVTVHVIHGHALPRQFNLSAMNCRSVMLLEELATLKVTLTPMVCDAFVAQETVAAFGMPCGLSAFVAVERFV